MRTLSEQVAAVASGDVSSAELVERALSEAERVQPSLNAFTHFLFEDARERAKAPAPGPLSGVPIAVKELYDVAGLPSTGCCAAYADRIATRDSAVVEALRGAGAIVVAKTNQHELACGATTAISSFGAAHNPWDVTRTTGGSSGGSGAAVAAGVVAMAMGSDTGGSIRIPSSLCGVTGLKPTHGAISLRGAMPMCPSFDTAGPLAASAADCRLVWSVLVGFDPDDLHSRERPLAGPRSDPKRLRVAIPQTFMRAASEEVRTAVEAAARVLESQGMVLDEIEGPSLDDAGAAFAYGFPELANRYRDVWDDPRVHPQVAGLINAGRNMSGPDAAGTYDLLLKVRRDFEWALTSADVLLAPCTMIPAPVIPMEEESVGRTDTTIMLAGLTMPVNVAGLPALALPVGFSSEGLPLGAQLIGRAWSEELLLDVGEAYQTVTDWHARHPYDGADGVADERRGGAGQARA